MLDRPDYFSQFLVELVGSFIFFTIIISIGHPIIVGLSLMVLIVAAFSVTGAYFNPAVTFMFYLRGDIDSIQLGLYILSQILAAVFAFLFYTRYLKNLPIPKRFRFINCQELN